MVLPWGGPAPDVDPRMGALSRGASIRGSEDRCYALCALCALWWDAAWWAWRSAILSAHEPAHREGMAPPGPALSGRRDPTAVDVTG